MRYPNGTLTRTEYDAQGNKISQRDAEGRVTRWSYDDLGRQTSRTLPGGQTETFEYDAVGNRIRHTEFDAQGCANVAGAGCAGATNGDSTDYQYDVLNREVSRTYADGTTVTTTYTASGQVETVTDAKGITAHEYDPMDRLSQISYPSGQRIEYSYDARGNRITLASGSNSISYRYNALSQLESVVDSEGTTRYEYDALGRQREVRYPNGAITTTEYDALGRPTLVEARDAAGQVIARTQYTLDAAGHRTRLTELDVQGCTNVAGAGCTGATDRTVDYHYDALYRLTQETIADANGSRTTTWSYDKVGNRLSQTVNGVTTSYVYDGNDRLLTESGPNGTTTYGYDANGQTTSKSGPDGTVTYTWNPDGRLIGANTHGQNVSYTYDVHGIRQSKTENGLTTRYLVDPNQPYAQVIGEYQNGSEQAWYTHGTDLLSQTRGNTTHYFHTDALGSTRALTDGAGQLSDSYAYMAFGELHNSTGATENLYRFAGEQFDSALGQYYLRDRYMDPAVGRFTRQDTFSGYDIRPITLHRYVYGNGDPANWVDPSGKVGIGNVFGAMGGFARLVSTSAINYTRMVASRVNGRVVTGVASLQARLWLKRTVGQVQSRLPSELGKGTHSKAGDGWRWYSKSHSVRLQRGNPDSIFPAQRVDYVKITSNGKVVGRNGKTVSSSSAEEAHIPLTEWRTWMKWDAL